MKTKLILSFIIILFSLQVCHAQKFTFGIENGINYSNVHKKYDYDRFAAVAGPVNGIFAKYQLGNFFLLQSGLNHATFHFNERQYYYYYSDYYPTSYFETTLSSSIAPYYSTDRSYYSFLRIPLVLKFRTPGKLNFEIGGGAYYAFLTNDEYRGKDRDNFTKEYRDENFPKMHDRGWILESSVNYNINEKWSVFASGRVTYGKEEYFENVEGKTGSTELTFGIGYKPFTKNSSNLSSDSLGQNISILAHSGILVSNTKSTENKSEYKTSLGLSTGVSLKFQLGENIALLTGAWYERKGYGLNYQGYHNAFYKNPIQSERENAPQIESEIQLDYLTIPFMFNIDMGNKIQSSLNFGCYFSLLQNAFAEGERIETYTNNQSYQITKSYFNDSADELFRNTDTGLMLSYRISYPIFQWANMFLWFNQSFGVKNILNNDDETTGGYINTGNEKIYNRATSILIGLTIPVN